MAYIIPQPPHVNGVMDLIETEQETLRNQLNTIITDFVPSEEYPVVSTFYLVVEHTRKHSEQTTFTQLNGDTVEYLLSLTEEVVQQEGV